MEGSWAAAHHPPESFSFRSRASVLTDESPVGPDGAAEGTWASPSATQRFRPTASSMPWTLPLTRAAIACVSTFSPTARALDVSLSSNGRIQTRLARGPDPTRGGRGVSGVVGGVFGLAVRRSGRRRFVRIGRGGETAISGRCPRRLSRRRLRGRFGRHRDARSADIASA